MTAFLSSPWEIGVVLVLALLLFGNRIPSLARSLGSGIVEFKRGLKSGENEASTRRDPELTAGRDDTGTPVSGETEHHKART